VVSVLAYRLIGYWLPTIAEAVAFMPLRRSIGRLAAPGIGDAPSRQAG